MTGTDPWLPDDPAKLLVADPGRREPISFESDGHRLAAHLYRPPQAVRGEVTPGIVMTGPVSSVKEQTLPHYGERFADAGYTVLAFDPRGFGESGGEPRFHYDPWLIVSDYVGQRVPAVAAAAPVVVDHGEVAGQILGGRSHPGRVACGPADHDQRLSVAHLLERDERAVRRHHLGQRMCMPPRLFGCHAPWTGSARQSDRSRLRSRSPDACRTRCR
jgi:pimeloyl-ACP methyl ester carboxylesterase